MVLRLLSQPYGVRGHYVGIKGVTSPPFIAQYGNDTVSALFGQFGMYARIHLYRANRSNLQFCGPSRLENRLSIVVACEFSLKLSLRYSTVSNTVYLCIQCICTDLVDEWYQYYCVNQSNIYHLPIVYALIKKINTYSVQSVVLHSVTLHDRNLFKFTIYYY